MKKINYYCCPQKKQTLRAKHLRNTDSFCVNLLQLDSSSVFSLLPVLKLTSFFVSKNFKWFWKKLGESAVSGASLHVNCSGEMVFLHGVLFHYTLKILTNKMNSQLPCLTLSIKGTVWKTSRQVYLCRWEKHFKIPYLRVIKRWPATPDELVVSL